MYVMDYKFEEMLIAIMLRVGYGDVVLTTLGIASSI